MDIILKGIGLFFLSAFLIIFAAFLMGFPTMWLWNWLMPAIFGLVKISIWKAIGLNMLFGILVRASPKISSDK